MKIPGAFLLVFIFSSGVLTSCKKHHSENYTSDLGGIRVWQGTRTGYNAATMTSYSDTLSDTFAITVVDSRSINIKGDQLVFLSKNNDSDVMTFYYSNSVGKFYLAKLTYNYNMKTLHYRVESDSASSSDITDLHTP